MASVASARAPLVVVISLTPSFACSPVYMTRRGMSPLYRVEDLADSRELMGGKAWGDGLDLVNGGVKNLVAQVVDLASGTGPRAQFGVSTKLGEVFHEHLERRVHRGLGVRQFH